MAISTCIKCASTEFEVVKLSPSRANVPFWAVQCSQCGGVIGTHEYLRYEDMLRKQQAALAQIASSLNVIINWDTL